jgi:type I restriction enzyme S subunit
VEVKPGRESEAGALPDDWEPVPFSQLLEFRNGVNAEKAAYGTGVPFINVLEVITRTHLRASDIPGRIALPERILAAYQVRQGDVLFNRTSETQDEVGLAAVYVDQEPVVFGGFVIRGRPSSDSRLDSGYSGYALRSPQIRRQIVARGQGAIRANIGQQDLRTVLVPRPPLAEQKAIAAALRDVDALIQALDQLIAKKRDLQQATLQQLLTGKTRLPGFPGSGVYQATEVGIVPGDWSVLPLRALAAMKSGETITSASLDGFSPFPCYGGNGLRGYTTRFTHDGEYALIGRQGAHCGNVLGVRGKFYASEHAVVVTPAPRTDIRWLTYVLAALRLHRYSESSAQPGLSVGKVLQLVVASPGRQEQRAIAAVLSDMDDELVALEQRRDKTRLLKQGMLQELLTGRTRLG